MRGLVRWERADQDGLIRSEFDLGVLKLPPELVSLALDVLRGTEQPAYQIGVAFLHAGQATEGSAKLLGRMLPNNPGLSLKELDKLGEELYALMRISNGGATTANIAQQPTLMRLRVAYDEARSGTTARPTAAAIAQALRGLIEEATRALSSTESGNNVEGKAARIYLALEPDSMALLLKDRRQQAELYMPVKLRSASRRHGPDATSHEKRLMEGVASQLIEREFDHLDGIARAQLLHADNWAPQPHAAIYKAHRGAFALWSSLLTIQGRKTVGGCVDKLVSANQHDEIGRNAPLAFVENMVKYRDQIVNELYDLRLLAALLLGRLFVTVEYIEPRDSFPCGVDLSRLSAREAAIQLCALLPFDADQVRYLTSVYADGKARCGFSPMRSAPTPGLRSREELEEDFEIVRWVFREYSHAEWEPLESLLHQTWDTWVLCNCWDFRHAETCPVYLVTELLDVYCRKMTEAWERLQKATQSPTIEGFGGWHDGRRLYHDLGLRLP